MDYEAREAWQHFLDLGRRYLDGLMPPWLRQTLNKELLTPHVKAALPPGRELRAGTWTSPAGPRASIGNTARR